MDFAEHAVGKLPAFRIIIRRLIAGRPLLAEPVDPLFGGLPAEQWMSLYYACHEPSGFGGMRRIEWPDEGGVSRQAYVTVMVFSEIGAELSKELESNRGSSS